MCRKLRPEITKKKIKNQSKNQNINTDRNPIKATSKISKFYDFFLMQILIKEALFQCIFCPSLKLGLQKIFSDLKWAIERSLISKWGPGDKM